MIDKGIVEVGSRHTVDETVSRLRQMLDSKGVKLFAVVDHSGEAAGVGMTMPSTKLLIFGNPKAGTPLMQSNQTIGVDLPLKVLGWQDAEGKVWLTYNDPSWLARRHRLGPSTDASVNALATALANLAQAAAG